MSITPQVPTPRVIPESAGRKNSVPKVKAPFRLTTMNQRGKCLLMWVWSLRGKEWTVDQELRFDGVSKRDESRS